MGVLTSDVAICSRALVLLGQGSISAFTEPGGEAAEQLFDPTKTDLLSGHAWRFAMSKMKLQKEATAPINEWRTAFSLPPDREGAPRAVFDSEGDGANPIQNYEIFGKRLYAMVDDIWVDYKTEPPISDWPPYFQQLVIYAMAALLAMPVTDDVNKANFWWKVAFGDPVLDAGKGGYFRTARNLDSQDNPAEAMDDGGLIAARTGAI